MESDVAPFSLSSGTNTFSLQSDLCVLFNNCVTESEVEADAGFDSIANSCVGIPGVNGHSITLKRELRASAMQFLLAPNLVPSIRAPELRVASPRVLPENIQTKTQLCRSSKSLQKLLNPFHSYFGFINASTNRTTSELVSTYSHLF